MSKNKDKKSGGSVSKDLLYSEILNISVADHVHELLQKKKKNSTFHVQRSSVLDRASKVLQSLKEAKNDVQNIEIVEEGETVIDMSVTLVDRDDERECESDDDTRNSDFENGVKGRKLIICSDSDSDSNMSDNGSEEFLDDTHTPTDSDSELSENESKDNVLKNMLLCSNLDIKGYEKGEKNINNDINVVTSSDLEDKLPESEMEVLKESKLLTSNSDVEQFENKISEFVLDGHNNKLDSDDELPSQECSEEIYLKHSELEFGQKTSLLPDSNCKNQSYLHKFVHSGLKRKKIISVIDEVDEQNMCHSTKQKKV